MRLPSHELIKELANKRELSLGEVIALNDRKFNNHKDFYVFSTLYTKGFIGVNISDVENSKGNDNQLAKMFYAMSLEKNEIKSDGLTPITGLGMRDQLYFHCTAKADIYLAELRKVRYTQIITLATGIIIAIVSTLLAICSK